MKRTLAALVVALALTGLLAAPAAAVLKGQPDSAHPYVGLLDDGYYACTGALISPTVVVTAAHCFSEDTTQYGHYGDGAPRVEVTFAQDGFYDTSAVYHTGAYYWDHAFANPAGPGLVGFDTHDVAVVILDSAVTEVTTYAALPTEDLVDSLPNNTNVDVVGYGAQHFGVGGGPCYDGAGNHVPCTPYVDAIFTREIASGRLVPSNGAISDEFIKINAAKGGTCFGDSGGPDFVGDTKTMIGINSFVTNGRCNGVTYSYRADISAALDFINDTIAAHS